MAFTRKNAHSPKFDLFKNYFVMITSWPKFGLKVNFFCWSKQNNLCRQWSRLNQMKTEKMNSAWFSIKIDEYVNSNLEHLTKLRSTSYANNKYVFPYMSFWYDHRNHPWCPDTFEPPPLGYIYFVNNLATLFFNQKSFINNTVNKIKCIYWFNYRIVIGSQRKTSNT